MKYLFVPFLLISTLYAHDFDQYKWRKHSQKSGIIVYKADSEHKSGLVPIRAEAIIDYPLANIVSVLSDSDRKSEWVPRQVVNTIVEEKNPFDRIEYSQYSAPWPLKDRTFIIKVLGNYNEKEKLLTIDISSVKHPKFPLKEEFVRGETYRGRIELKKLGPNKTAFQTWLITDFKGGIPNWVINLLQAKWPYKLVKNLNKQLARPDIVVHDHYKSLL